MRTVIMSASITEADKLRSEMGSNTGIALMGYVSNEDELSTLCQFSNPDALVWATGSLKSTEIADILGSLPESIGGLVIICENPAAVQSLLNRAHTNALYWLRAPYGKGELNVLLATLKKELSRKHLPSIDNGIESGASACLEWETAQIKRLGLQTLSEIHFVCIRDIMYCKASGSYTEFFLHNGNRIMTSTSIKRYEEMLVGYGFFRAHKSYLINNLHVRRIIKTGYGFAEMSDGSQIEISRRKKEGFLTSIMEQVLTKD
jgi:hypothetical protein